LKALKRVEERGNVRNWTSMERGDRRCEHEENTAKTTENVSCMEKGN
jgi:hypothetical protein